MQRRLISNVLAAALAASFAGGALAQDPNTDPVPPVERVNPTPPVNPEAARDPVQAEQARERAQDATTNPQGTQPRTGQPHAAAEGRHDAKDRKDKDWSDKDWSDLSPQDFVAKALASGRKEVESARTAQQRATDPRVKQLAQTIERDHGQLNTRLEALNGAGAGAAAVPGSDEATRPTGMRAVDDAGKGAKGETDRLASLQGAAYDREYVAMQVKMHDKSIAMYQAASDNGDNADVQALAREALPILRRHAEQAKSLQASLGGN
jgi:putative membrane protein